MWDRLSLAENSSSVGTALGCHIQLHVGRFPGPSPGRAGGREGWWSNTVPFWNTTPDPESTEKYTLSIFTCTGCSMLHFTEIQKQECCSRKTTEEKGGYREAKKQNGTVSGQNTEDSLGKGIKQVKENNKRTLLASWALLGRALPTCQGRWFFSLTQHWWDISGVLCPVLDSHVQERHGRTGASSVKGYEDD